MAVVHLGAVMAVVDSLPVAAEAEVLLMVVVEMKVVQAEVMQNP